MIPTWLMWGAFACLAVIIGIVLAETMTSDFEQAPRRACEGGLTTGAENTVGENEEDTTYLLNG